MNTLYDILGIGRQATQAQIEQAYQTQLDAILAADGTKSEQGTDRVRFVREAYLVLSSPSRRQTYNARLQAKETVAVEIIDAKPVPWFTIALVCIALLAGGVYLRTAQVKKEKLEQLRLETARVKDEAEKAAQLAAAEQSALARDMLQKRQQDELTNRRLSDQARHDGQRIHADLQQASLQTAREKERRDQQSKYDEARARQDELRAQQDAQNRSRNEIARMERALSIPIRRH